MEFAEITPTLSNADEALNNPDKLYDFQILFKNI